LRNSRSGQTVKRPILFIGALLQRLVGLRKHRKRRKFTTMNALNWQLPHLKRLASALLIFASFGKACRAQQFKDVEIEVVGPWSIAPDPRPSAGPSRLVLIAPITAKTQHQVDVYPGGDAYSYKKDVTAGSYSLNFTFDPNNCDGNQQSNLLSFVPVQVSPNDVLSVINSPNNRYAISLPKPCYFETYLDARSIVSATPIKDASGDRRYSTWLKFHYRVATSVTSASFGGNSDASGMISPYPIPFNASAHPPKSQALTVVLYDEKDPEDYDCDSHSAMFFDASVVGLWKQTGVFRLFPELDGGHNQSGAYNLTCSQIPGKSGMIASTPDRAWFLEQIGSIRNALRSSDIGGIERGVSKLKEGLAQVLGNRFPLAIDDDLAAVSRIKNFLQQDKANKFQAINADEYLRVTEYIVTAGRTDCHSMQINVNNAVN